MDFSFLYKFNSIKAKLIIMILGIVISIVLGLTSVIGYTTTSFWEDESKRQLFQNLEQSVYLLQNFLEVRESNTEIWRNSPLVEPIFRNATLASVFVPSLRQEFETIKTKEPWLLHIFLLQDDQIVYDDSGMFEFSDGQNGVNGIENLKALPVQGVSVTNLKQFDVQKDRDVIVIKRPFLADGKVVEGEYIIVMIDLRVVTEKLFEKLRIGKRGFIAFTGVSLFGELIVKYPDLEGEEIQDFITVSQTWKSFQDIPDTFGAILMRKQDLEAYPLSLIGVVSQLDLREPVVALLQQSFVFGLLALIFGIFSAVFYATKLTGPIQELTRKARLFAHSGISAAQENTTENLVSAYLQSKQRDNDAYSSASYLQIVSNRIDELNLLKTTFDAMVDKLAKDTEVIMEITRTFEKFVPKQFVSHITNGGLEPLRVGNYKKEFITILFSDIRNFTTLSETMQPDEVIRFLNRYFKNMSDSIQKNHGFVDKFIGDAIMALFDRTNGSNAERIYDAIQGAIGMQEALKSYNTLRVNEGYDPIVTGIGIHSGPVIVGTVGWEDRVETTVIGNNVNLASRIEGLTKVYGAEILISAWAFRELDDPNLFKHRELDWVRVKGIKEPIGVYEILETESPEIQKLKLKTGKAIYEALFQRQKKNWDAAIKVLESALPLFPEDKALHFHIQSCQELKNAQLPDDWDGAVNLQFK